LEGKVKREQRNDETYFGFHGDVAEGGEGIGSGLLHFVTTSLRRRTNENQNCNCHNRRLTSLSMSRSFGEPFFNISAQFLALSFCSTVVRDVGEWSNAILMMVAISWFCFDCYNRRS
jgi:hypothetical protein